MHDTTITQEERYELVKILREGDDPDCWLCTHVFKNDCKETSCSELVLQRDELFANLIEDAVDTSRYIEVPLDKNGVPCKIGETVYSGCDEFVVDGYTIVQERGGIGKYIRHGFVLSNPQELTHVPTRTLDSIISDAQYSDNMEDVEKFVREAYELGKKEASGEGR